MGDNPLLVAAGRFHGHIGPFLAVGLRMGLLANECLGRAPLETEASVRVKAEPPRSCAVDGIQFATGCTMGKGNIRIEPDPGDISVTFMRGSRRMTVRLLKDVLKRLEVDLEGVPEKAVIDYAFKIMDTQLEEMFEVT
jgi:formylmethanofuran dehydrogenase subunit E